MTGRAYALVILNNRPIAHKWPAVNYTFLVTVVTSCVMFRFVQQALLGNLI